MLGLVSIPVGFRYYLFMTKTKDGNVVTKKLANGLTVVTIDLPHFHSVTNLLVTRSGSRYEADVEYGLAHFLEHLAFKGTESFPTPKDVAESIESVGGYLNAWTSYECTAYWNVVPAAHYKLGVQLPFEMAFKPLLQKKDIEQERGVIIEEIRRGKDSPSSLAYDISQELTYANDPLGRTVIGTEESVTSLTHEQFKRYHDKFYNPSQAYFVAIGAIGEIEGFNDYVYSYFEALASQPPNSYQPFGGQEKGAVKLLKKDTEQAHFILSVSDPSFALTKSERYVGVLLSSILGEGMSSRLFMNVRERKGLAYSINANVTIYEDTGDFWIHSGVNVKKIDQALLAVDEELRTISRDLVSDAELKKVKSMIIGSFDISSDKPLDLASWYGTSRLLGMKESREDAIKAFESVTAEQIRTLAKKIFQKEKMTLAVVGPFDSDEPFKKFLQT